MSQHLSGVGPDLVLPGEVLAGKYKVERVLGMGGWGLVLAARNLQLGHRVAIKLLAREKTPDAQARMLREAQAAARIHSDHVVRVFDVGCTESDTPYIVMEYLEGQDLASLLQRGGAVPVALAVHWVLQACAGLAAAQRHGIVHRDLKPANLFLERRPDGSTRLKLLDFGIAKLPDVTGLTQAGGFMGSPAYMAPEQLLDSRDVDGRTDVWSLGVVLYELLTAQRPFAAAAPLALITQVRDQQHPALTSLSKEVPEGLSRIVDRCLAKSREARWQGLVPLARALAAFAPAQGGELVGAIEHLGAVHDDQRTLDADDARAGPRTRAVSDDAEAVRDAESVTGPPGLAATLAGPRVLRSRVLFAGLLLAALALALGFLRRPQVAVAPPNIATPQAASPVATPPASSVAPPAAASAVTSAAASAAASALTPPTERAERAPEQLPPQPPAPVLARQPRRVSPARSATPAGPPASAPAVEPGKTHTTPPSGAGAPPEPPSNPPQAAPVGGPLPIDRRGPWN
jgi:serine/threonine-protein kinase